MKEAQAPPSDKVQKSNGPQELAHEPQVPPLKLGILIFMFLCEYPSLHPALLSPLTYLYEPSQGLQTVWSCQCFSR